ncbi:hypothetical protein [Pararhodobacter aggregans]|uniref:Uncharacterized protein n=1 Tax=Pararhodobacter aggregans TaxID=404875 RepID=A0A2T7UTM6_9RHOB|nr:hypothetical protein [Pararhodobacter aggregans]PTX02788.1 hypothetical protein C8N33_104148 [Pararhodobacter aggregans]PVE48014.1 hypothetical protein DDE23_07690 [Pararhodobacter aggregans]
MNRVITTAAVAAFAALGAVAAHAADVNGAGIVTPSTVAATSSAHTLRAGNVYSARDLAVAGLNASDVLEVQAPAQLEVRAGDVYSSRDLNVAGLNANDLVVVSNFADPTRNPSTNDRRSLSDER